VLGAGVHAAIAVALAGPHAQRAVVEAGGTVEEADTAWRASAISVLLFLIAATVLRLLAEFEA
jgi:hypothetical protein